MGKRLNITTGLMTCKQRVTDEFPLRTLAFLRRAGFDDVRIFADGLTHQEAAVLEREGGVPVTSRPPPNVRTFGSFMLAAWELYLRAPEFDLMCVAQDDISMGVGVREYLERCPHPEKGYRNLFTFRENDPDIAKAAGAPNNVPVREGGWCGGWTPGWFLTSQKGRSACFLVFNRAAVLALLSSEHMAERPLDFMRGHRAIDGGVVTALNKAGISEWAHYPSLVQHTGEVSSMGSCAHKPAMSYRGDDWDVRELLGDAGGV